MTRRTLLSTLALPAIARPQSRGEAFALIGDRYHNSDYIRTALNRTIGKDLNISIDFTDETKALNADTLKGRKLLIILRDGMIWPDGYPDENTNAAWVATGRPSVAAFSIGIRRPSKRPSASPSTRRPPWNRTSWSTGKYSGRSVSAVGWKSCVTSNTR